ncbi:serine/threonine-protein kinase [Gemmatimonas phototrophica]|uniref:serine/threonine-protein kinase n=1 Tax=Gemmatimonas phototrophica TaxID=1379270 RepID=UPI0006A74AFB|nr:serine/threonine-protein kinase [Gemmatimonas phototrophica]
MTAPLRDQLQRSLGDTLLLQRELGGGGMSRVFLARDEALGRDVVVKVLSPELAAGLSTERFTREIKLAASLQEPHIVPVLTAGTTSDGLPWFTMPFVAGESLRVVLTRGTVPTAEALGILRNVAQALAYAHARGIVHRDIKPDNVLLSSGTAVVADFGIAKALNASRTQANNTGDGTALTQAGMAIGTPAYMAPEQATGDSSTDHRADIYAWGVLAYELLQGAHPFADRTTPAAMTAAHIATPAPAITALGASPAVRALIAQCLAKDPAARPSSMEAVLAALSTSGEVSAAPTRASAQSRTSLALLAVALVAVAGGVAWWSSRSPAPASSASAAPATAESDASLAVIPFASVGGDTANTYLAEGIADELTTVLSRVPGLRLAGRSTSARFKNSALSAQQLGDTLGVRTILLGSLRREGNRVRVTAELSNASDGRVLWQDTFEQDARDVFRMQELLAQAIGAQLQLRLGSTTVSAGTSNPEAYEQYLRGMQVYRNRGPVFTDAERYFDAAIRADSSFARAWAGKSIALMATPYYVLRHMRDVLPVARVAAARALALDSLNPDVHIALSAIAAEEFDWANAEREAKRAISLDSTNSIAYWRLGFNRSNQGRVADALVAFTRARVLDPLSAIILAWEGATLASAGRFDEGVALAIRAHDLAPTVAPIQTIMLTALAMAGRHAEGAERAAKLAPLVSDPMYLGGMARALAMGGQLGEATRISQRLERMGDDVRGVWYGRLSSRLVTGDTSGALAALEAAAASDGDLVPSVILANPWFDAIRTAPRFKAAMKRYNLENSPLVQANGGRLR